MLGFEENRQKLGVNPHSASYEQKFFYNLFVSQLIFNQNKSEEAIIDREIEQCQEILERVAIVELSMVPNDAIVFSETISDKTGVFTGSGGILGLYAGFSFLSMAEIAFWVMSTVWKIWFKKLIETAG